jgi:hypothetical protein
MKAISKVEQEVNQIRLKIYEEIKDMTPAQLFEYYRQSTEATIKKYGFKVILNAKENPPSLVES